MTVTFKVTVTLFFEMWAAVLLGFTGSLGHCIGMCSGVSLLLSRRGQARGWRVLFLHLGRVTTYSLLGAVAGGIGYSLITVLSYCLTPLTGGQQGGGSGLPGIVWIQGALALFTAVLAVYMALSLIGRLPSPELLLAGLTRRWGQWMRRAASGGPPAASGGVFTLYGLGMLWGLLPCGLVMAALVAAAASGSPQNGALTMLAFGLGTWPVTVGISLAARLKGKDARQLARPQFRYAASILILLFGAQMALRGLAAWGWVGHYHLGSVMLC